MKNLVYCACLASMLLIAACADGNRNLPFPPPAPDAGWFVSENLAVIAGMAQQPTEPVDNFSARQDLKRLAANGFTRAYEFTTPYDTAFNFSIVARRAANEGTVTIALGHATAGGSVPTTGVESLTAEGIRVEAADMVYGGDWLLVGGDGFARLTLSGRILQEQELVARVSTSVRLEVVIIRIRIGAASDINIGGQGAGNPGAAVKSSTALFSSDSRQTGLPAIAVSGDRYSVAMYDGDPGAPDDFARIRRWLQLDALTGSVTGGESVAVGADTGNWRDQEICALNNVLAVATTGGGVVRAEVSLDRGGSFTIDEFLNEGVPSTGQRLVQIEIAPDYRIGVLYWRTVNVGGALHSELAMVEAVPTGFSAGNPVGYNFGQATVVYAATGTVLPVLMDLEYSVAGDLVIGYGFTEWIGWVATTYYRCAVQLAGGVLIDRAVDQEVVSWGNDPSVAVIGSGASMEIFYAYDKTTGVELRYSNNAGAGFVTVMNTNRSGDYMPSVHARMQGGKLAVDLLCLSLGAEGFELNDYRWADFMGGLGTVTRIQLTQSSATSGGTPYAGNPQGRLVTVMGRFGYDAVTHGDDVAVVIHEVTFDLGDYWSMPPTVPPPQSGGVPPPSFFGQPVLLPGMTNPVPPASPGDASQIRIVVLD